MKSTLCALAIAGCAAALAPAGAAAAKPPKTAKFLVQVTGTQTLTWNEPRSYTGGDCEGRTWTEAAGQETIEFRTKESKVLITDTGRVPKLRLGTWNPRSKGDARLRGKGSVDRTGEEVFGLDPGACFKGGETRRTTGPYDCRAIPLDYDVDIDWTSTLAAIATPKTTPAFGKCPVEWSHPVIPTKFTEVRSEPIKAKRLLGLKAHDVVGQAEFREDTQYRSTEAKVRWTIRFKRVK